MPVGLLFAPRYPSALFALAAAIVLGRVLDVPGIEFTTMASAAFSIPPLPSLAETERAFSLFVLPQLSLTFTNAVLLTAIIASGYFGDRSQQAGVPRRLQEAPVPDRRGWILRVESRGGRQVAVQDHAGAGATILLRRAVGAVGEGGEGRRELHGHCDQRERAHPRYP
jgi:hypothetical protein